MRRASSGVVRGLVDDDLRKFLVLTLNQWKGVFLLSSHQRTTKTRGDLDIHHGRKLWRHDQKAGRGSAQLATSFRVAIIGASPEIYRHLGAPRRRKISTFRRRWRRTGRGPGCWRLKFVTWTSMMRLKKCGTQSVRGRDLTGGRFLSSISTTASRRSVSTSGSTSICGTKPRIRAAKMTAHRQAARRPRQVRTRTRTRRPSSRYKMPGGLGRHPDQPKPNRTRQRRVPQ